MSIDKKPLKLAMVGCGGYAGYLIDRLAELPADCKLVAVTARNPDDESAQKCKAQGFAVYRDIDELLNALSPEECPAVILPTSIESHYEYTKKAVARGFHVLLEKPPVATIQDLDRLIELQRTSGKWIAVNFQHLFNPMTQRIKRQLAAGDFGAVRSVRARALWPRPESYFSRSFWSGKLQLDGRWVLDGTVGNPLAHMLAEALYLATPAPGMAAPICVQAELYHANEIESEDTSCLRVETREGVRVFYCASLCSKEKTPVFCKIETDEAVLELTDYFQLCIRWNDGRVEEAETPDNDLHQDRRIMLKSLVKSLANGERPLITVEECRPYVLAWNGAFESSGLPSSIIDFARESTDDNMIRCIKHLPEITQSAFDRARLFSELGVEWACSGTPVQMMHYKRFPSANRELMCAAPRPTKGTPA